jgi:hypothetical protein
MHATSCSQMGSLAWNRPGTREGSRAYHPAGVVVSPETRIAGCPMPTMQFRTPLAARGHDCCSCC